MTEHVVRFGTLGRVDTLAQAQALNLSGEINWILILQHHLTGQCVLTWGTADESVPFWGKAVVRDWKERLQSEWGIRQNNVKATIFSGLGFSKPLTCLGVRLTRAKVPWGIIQNPGQPVIPINDVAERHRNTPEFLAFIEVVRRYMTQTVPCDLSS